MEKEKQAEDQVESRRKVDFTKADKLVHKFSATLTSEQVKRDRIQPALSLSNMAGKNLNT